MDGVEIAVQIKPLTSPVSSPCGVRRDVTPFLRKVHDAVIEAGVKA